MEEGRDLFLVCNNIEVLGGVQTWAHYMARLFTRRGHRVHLIGIVRPKRVHDHGTDFPYARTVLHERPPGGRWELRGVRARASRRKRAAHAEQWRGVRRLAEILREARPGGVVVCAEVWAMEWVQRALPEHLKVVGMVHESYQASKIAGRHPRILRHFAGADRLLALTRADADDFARDGMTNADFIPNPLHVVPRRYAELDAPVVVRLGRLDYEKGQDLLLEAWARIAPDRPDWTLRIHGADKSGGKEERRLLALTEELGLAGRVEWPGPTSDIETALCAGSVFALTSREEGFPMAILEAMAYGVPCVAFDIAPGVGELITDGVDGLVVPAGNITAFAAALHTLIEDGELRRKMGRAARDSVQRFAPDLVAARWEGLFDLLYR
ncbi:glycosyltransferase [Actinomadura macrotermitis]|uniref:Glycosyltransferase Gtf1 n=1 Tax=Actinomadura macrotermitis TaxID=2585200 RepID=A0A7K0C225_9ACTN|nr:glycosyltransferase [Actinomadura macrotermitis]MQY07508.1 Glycosyltransferase Gtf1 [Actinomadura macrotermitis]